MILFPRSVSAKITFGALIIFMQIGSNTYANPDFEKEQCICEALDISLESSQKPQNGLTCSYDDQNGLGRCTMTIGWSSNADDMAAARASGEETYRSGTIAIITENENSEVTGIIDLDDRFVFSYSAESQITSNDTVYHKKMGQILYRNNFIALIEAGSTVSPAIANRRFAILEQHYMTLVDSLLSDTSLTLTHDHPFDCFEAETGTELKNAGNITIRLVDGEGKGVSGKQVFLYQETGTTLEDALRYRLTPPAKWLAAYSNFPNSKREAYIGYGYTGSNGEATVNYIKNRCIDPHLFTMNIIKEGSAEGIVRAVTLNDNSEITAQAVLPMKFEHIAQILEIKGDGWPDTADANGTTVSGPGTVRITRPFGESFVRKEVSEGFRLKAGDILNIDGGVSVEIAWLNGNRAIAKVPKYLNVQNNSIPVPNLNIILLATAYESGFHTMLDKLLSYVSGLTIQKGISVLISAIPYADEVKNVGETMVDIWNLYDEVDMSNIDLVSRVRIRSVVLINTETDTMSVFTVEGTPDIKNAAGEEVSLVENEMVSFTDSSITNEPISFTVTDDIPEWEADVQHLVEEIDALPVRHLPAAKNVGRSFIRSLRCDASKKTVELNCTVNETGRLAVAVYTLKGEMVASAKTVVNGTTNPVTVRILNGHHIAHGLYIVHTTFTGAADRLEDSRTLLVGK